MTKKNLNVPAPPVQGTLELPYDRIDTATIASRDMIREMAAEKKASYGRQSYHIEYKIIQPRPGFNCRLKPIGMSEEDWEKELEIEVFAMDLLKNGMGTPLEGDLVKIGKKTVFLLTAGERRWRAIGWLIRNGYKTQANGKPMNLVEVLFNSRDITEEQRISRMVTTDNNLKYKPIELGHAFLRLKTFCNKTHESIAQEYGKSRQTVDNFIKLAQEPQSIQTAIILGKLTTTAAIELINTEKDPKRRETIVAGSVDTGNKLKVKDIGEGAKYKNYYEQLAMYVGQYNDEVVTYDGAVFQCKEIAAKATAALPDQKEDIAEALKNTLEVLLNNKAIRDAEERTTKTKNDKKVTGIKFDWKGKFLQIVEDYKNDTMNYLQANTAAGTCESEAHEWDKDGVHEDTINQDYDTALETIEELKKIKEKKPAVVETKLSLEQEEQSRKTSDKTPIFNPKNDGDALEPIDFKKDKELGEFELNEAIKTLDKLQVKLDLFPKNLKQYVDDCAGLCVVTKNKIQIAIDIIKKAPDKR